MVAEVSDSQAVQVGPVCAMEAAAGRGARRKPHVLVMQDPMMSAEQPSMLLAPIFHVFSPMPPGHVFLFS